MGLAVGFDVPVDAEDPHGETNRSGQVGPGLAAGNEAGVAETVDLAATIEIELAGGEYVANPVGVRTVSGSKYKALGHAKCRGQSGVATAGFAAGVVHNHKWGPAPGDQSEQTVGQPTVSEGKPARKHHVQMLRR